MGTVSARLDVSLSGSSLSAQLSGQVEKLTGLAEQIKGLIEKPPKSLADFGSALNELPLPNITAGSKFATGLGALRGLVPTDLEGITGNLLDGLDSLAASLKSDITGLLGQVLETVLAIYALTQADLTCRGEFGSLMVRPSGATAGGGAGGAGGGAPGASAEAGPAKSGVAQTTDQVDAIHSILNGAPDPFDIEGLLGWIDTYSTIRDFEMFANFPLPLIDEWLDPLHTLHAWKQMSPEQIRDHMTQTLQTLAEFLRTAVAGTVSRLAADLQAAAPAFKEDDLSAIASDLTAGLGQLSSAVSGGDVSGTPAAVGQLNGRLDQLDTLRQELTATVLPQIGVLTGRLRALPDDVSIQINHLLTSVRPNASLEFLPEFPPPKPKSNAADELTERLQPFVNWIDEILRHLDFSAIQQPLQQASETSRNAVETLEQSLGEVVVRVRALFSEVEAAIAKIDTAALIDEVKAAIQRLGDELRQLITKLFQPVKAAITAIVQAIESGINAFDPAQIVDALREVIDNISGVLTDPEIAGAANEIRSAIDTAAKQIEQLSFTPITDTVVAAIDEVTKALESIDTSKLNVMAQGALQAAVAILPPDLTPITGPVTVEFDALVDAGPVPLVNAVKAQPALLLNKVKSFEPGALVGESLSKPYQALLKQMDTFQPSKLLSPVDQELNRLKTRIRNEASPGKALKALEQPFQRLMTAFQALSPDQLVAPIDDKIRSSVNDLVTALPADEILDEVDKALKTVEDVVHLTGKIAALFSKLHAFFEGIANAGPQVQSWLDAILAKIDSMDAGPLAEHFTNLSAALDATKAALLGQSLHGGTDPLSAKLDSVTVGKRLNALVQAHANFPRAALLALPDSPEKAAITAVLARIRPIDSDFTAPYRALVDLRSGIGDTVSRFDALMAGWDARYHAADGTLASLKVTDATGADLKSWIQDALKPQFVDPVVWLLQILEPVGAPFGAVAAVMDSAASKLQAKLEELLLGPNSLGGIRDALRTLIDRIRGFNLQFLRDSLNEVFDQLTGKIAALNPANLAGAIDVEFDGVLQTISLAQILPQDQVAALDASYQALIDKLKQRDPGKLVIDVVQPQFEAKVLPLLEALDLTKVFEALLGTLEKLKGQLSGELDRVNQAYKEMLGAVPPLNLSLDVDIDIGVEAPF
jgi:hypothetical protein